MPRQEKKSTQQTSRNKFIGVFIVIVIIVAIVVPVVMHFQNKKTKNDNKPSTKPAVKLTLAPATNVFPETTTISPNIDVVTTTTITPQTTTMTPQTTTMTPQTTTMTPQITMISYDANKTIVDTAQSMFMPSMPLTAPLKLTAGVWQVNFSVQYQVEPTTTANSLWIRVYLAGSQVNQVNTDIPIVTQTITRNATGSVIVTSTYPTPQDLQLTVRTATKTTSVTILSSSDSTKNSYLQATFISPLTTTPTPSV